MRDDSNNVNSANRTDTPDETLDSIWHFIDWKKSNRIVRNLQQRIFRASSEGDSKKVRQLQKLLLRCQSNIHVSVRKVTQVNRGKNTAGMDGKVATTPRDRAMLVVSCSQAKLWKAKPARRVYIPKANGKLRPLGIPVIQDRALQAMVKNALEPEWEALFEGTSYGFRPGRSTHDAIGKIFLSVSPNKNKKWILDADIKGAFDNISHEFILDNLKRFPAREKVKAWLKAGYMDKGAFFNTEKGTPQGGVISPLLANIALHGMEEALTVRTIAKRGWPIKRVISPKGIKYSKRGDSVGARNLVRYADDFVVFGESKEDIERCKEILKRWLAKRGLELNEEKTRIVHITEGFDFLGFNVKQYKNRTTKTDWKLLIKPSKKSVKNIREKLKTEWLNLVGHPVESVLNTLNPIIRGQANYFRMGVSSRIFSGLDKWMFIRETRYTKRSHPTKSKIWRQKRYFGRLNLKRNDNWVFGDRKTGRHLLKFAWFKIKRHVIVKGKASPYDANLKEYWQDRLKAKAKDDSPSMQRLAAKTKGVCAICDQSLYNGEDVHKHHIISKAMGGKNSYANLILIHTFCHQKLHSIEAMAKKKN